MNPTQISALINSVLTLPVVAYVRRNVLLLTLLVGAVFLALDDRAFKVLGGLIYSPALVFATIALSALILHIFHRKSFDAYADPLVTEKKEADGTTTPVPTFATDFIALPAFQRATLYTAVRIGYALVIAIILATVWK